MVNLAVIGNSAGAIVRILENNTISCDLNLYKKHVANFALIKLPFFAVIIDDFSLDFSVLNSKGSQRRQYSRQFYI